MITPETILGNICEGLYCLDRERRIIFWNRAAELLTGYPSSEVLGRACSDGILAHIDSWGNELCLNGCPVSTVLQDVREKTSAFVFLRHRKGHRVPVNIRVSQIRGSSGVVVGASEIFWPSLYSSRDQCNIEEWRHAALVDSLTELANRRCIDLELISAVEESRRHNVPFGIIFADIDNFKNVNDKYGHDVGDRVLQMVSRTLSSSIRAYDHIGRWGGEEFLIIAKHLDADKLTYLALKLKALVAKSSILVGGRQIGVTMTMGTAHSAAHESISSMVKQADINLLRGKASGKNCVIATA
jgi:diguanylate cyclase (GGDEF)-like protein/PAS domain S-box-containing protein